MLESFGARVGNSALPPTIITFIQVVEIWVGLIPRVAVC
jgi:hypothetical protein